MREAESPEPWHRRLGHEGYENLAKMAEEELVSGVQMSGKVFREKKTLVSEPCILGKQTRESFPKESVKKAQNRFSWCTWTCADLCQRHQRGGTNT